jgi:hypothetical protein
MRSYVRHVLEERMNSGGGVAAEQDRSAGAGGRREIRRSVLNKLVRQRGKGDRFFRVRVGAEVGAGDQGRGGEDQHATKE